MHEIAEQPCRRSDPVDPRAAKEWIIGQKATIILETLGCASILQLNSSFQI